MLKMIRKKEWSMCLWMTGFFGEEELEEQVTFVLVGDAGSENWN